MKKYKTIDNRFIRSPQRLLIGVNYAKIEQVDNLLAYTFDYMQMQHKVDKLKVQKLGLMKFKLREQFIAINRKIQKQKEEAEK